MGGFVGNLLSQFDDMVRDVVPGGWATVGAAALLAAGISDPELLASAEEGTLTSSELSAAGVTTAEAQAAADIAAAYGSGYVPEGATYVGDQIYVNGVNVGSAADFGQTATQVEGGWQYSNPDATWFQPVAAEATAPAVATGTAEAAASGLSGYDAAMADLAAGTAPSYVAPVAATPTAAEMAAEYYSGLSGTAQAAVESNPGLLGYMQGGYLPEGAHIAADGSVLLDGEVIGAASDFGLSVTPTAGGVTVSSEMYGTSWFEPTAGVPVAAETSIPIPDGSVLTPGGNYMTPTGQIVDATGHITAEAIAAPTVAPSAALPPDLQAVVDQHFGGGGRVFEWEGQTWVETANGPQTVEYLQNTSNFFNQQAAAQAAEAQAAAQAAAQAEADIVAAQSKAALQAAGEAARSGIPSTAIQAVDAAGNTVYFDTATGQTLNAAGEIIAEAPAAGAGTQVASGYSAAQEAQYNELIKQGYTPAQAVEMIGPVSDVAPMPIEVTGAAGTADAPSYVRGPLTEGTQLATQAQVDANLATYNVASNAWEIAAPVAESTAGLTSAQLAGLAGGGILATSGGTAGLGAGGGAAPTTPVAAPPTTNPIPPTTTTTPPVVDNTPVAVPPTTTTTTTPPATTLPPVVDATPVPVAPPPVIAPPEIPPGEVPVVDAVPTPVDPTNQIPAGSGGLSVSDLALLAAGWTLVNGILTPPKGGTTSNGVYTPAEPDARWQRPLQHGGLNPGWIRATPYYQTTSPVQAQYYWGSHNPSTGTTNQWNTPIAAAPATPWGVQQAQTPLNIQQVIQNQLNNPLNQIPVAPVAPVAQ